LHALQVTEIEAARERLLELKRPGVARSTLATPRRGFADGRAVVARHVLLEGVPGIAKTDAGQILRGSARQLDSARAVHARPAPGRHHGTYVLSPRDGTFTLRAGPIFANVLLADEINRAPAKTQSALLEAMQERQVTIEGDRFELPDPFFVLATQNPVDSKAPTRCPKRRSIAS